jgi:fused signal recognition particle receptor
MTKPNKLFSWLGFGKKDPAPVTPEAVADTKPEASPATPASAVIQAETASAEPTTAVTAEPPVVTDNPATPALEATQAAAVAAEVLVTPVAVPEVIVAADSAAVIEIEVTPPAIAEPEPVIAAATVAPASSDNPKKPGFFARLKQGLAKTSQNLGAGLASLFLGKKIDDELYEELETQLLLADVGVETTQKLIKQLVADANRRQLKDAEVLYEKLQDEMALLLDKVEQPLQIDSSSGPYVILMVGVNGVGKTTTIGKLAQQFKQQGKSVMLAAGDTFRAAAVEQLQVWGERNEIPVIAQHSGADSASVIFDAYQAAKARKVDVLIADTAGRLQNKAHLMEELKKIVRVMKKIDGAAPHEVMLTLDAGTGQNALSQAKLFHEAVQLTGITLTKLDGTAKGGVIFAIADQFSLPIRYIGVGEGIDDLRVFQSRDFIRALFNREF